MNIQSIVNISITTLDFQKTCPSSKMFFFEKLAESRKCLKSSKIGFSHSKISKSSETELAQFFDQKIIRKCYLYILEVNGYVFCEFQGYSYFSNFYKENYWNIDDRYLTNKHWSLGLRWSNILNALVMLVLNDILCQIYSRV